MLSTPKIVFYTIFYCRTKQPDLIFLTGIHFPLYSFYTQNSIYIKLNASLISYYLFIITLMSPFQALPTIPLISSNFILLCIIPSPGLVSHIRCVNLVFLVYIELRVSNCRQQFCEMACSVIKKKSIIPSLRKAFFYLLFKHSSLP